MSKITDIAKELDKLSLSLKKIEYNNEIFLSELEIVSLIEYVNKYKPKTIKLISKPTGIGMHTTVSVLSDNELLNTENITDYSIW